MKKVRVIVEEHYTKEIEIGIPNCICENPDERLMLAENIVKEMYATGNIVMDKDDYNGVTSIMSEDMKTGLCCDWEQYNTSDTIKRAENKNPSIEIMSLCDFIKNATIKDVEKLLKKYGVKFTESKDEESNNDDYTSICRLPEFDNELEVHRKIHEIKEDDWDTIIEKIKNDEHEDEDEFDEIGRLCDMYPLPIAGDYNGNSISISDIKNNTNKSEEDEWDKIIRQIKQD